MELAGELAQINGGELNGRKSNVLVVIDQAEELITRSGENEQQAFLSLLGGALGEESPLWIVVTARSEFLSSAPERAGLAEVVDDPLLVEPLGRTRLPEVIERPAQRAGLDFEAGLVERMVEETTGGDALPLLAYTLQELRERVGSEGKVSFADYEAVGGVVGALQHRADRLRDELTRRGQGPLIVPTLLKLASVEGEEERSSLRMRSELERLAADWNQARRIHENEDSYLLVRGRLSDFRDWAHRHPGELGLIEHDFLRASEAFEERRIRRLRAVAGGPGILLVISVIAGVVAIWQTQQARSNAREARLQERVALAQQVRAEGPDVVVFSPDGKVIASASSNSTVRLWDAATGKPRGQPLTGHTGWVTGVAFSPDGKLLASASSDKTVRLWDVASGEPFGEPLTGPTDGLTNVAFSPDGKLLASGSINNRWDAWLWDVASGELVL